MDNISRNELPIDELSAIMEHLVVVRESREERSDQRLIRDLKYRKARAKTAFTKTRNYLLHLVLDEEELPSRKQVREARQK